MLRKDDVIENFHGTLVADPYRYLETEKDPDTVAYGASQQPHT